MPLRKTILFAAALFWCAALPCLAQYSQDTTSLDAHLDRLLASSRVRAFGAAAPLIIGSLVVKHHDTHFRRLRNDYMPSFSRHADDFLQYAPAAAMLGMKAAGVESRSSWGRMVASGALSYAVMGGAVNTLKYPTKVMRPDRSSRNSFPSGHTATAFLTATMLTKEYGHKSPLIGVGAYSVATATGLMRMANNKHWLSDVLMGAGVGIISAEAGYALGDLIFKDRDITPDVNEWNEVSDGIRPHFLSTFVGFNVLLSQYDINDSTTFDTSHGATSGLEGAYFLTDHIGVGARFSVTSSRIIANDTIAENNMLNMTAICGGVYASKALARRWLIGGKLLVGHVRYPSLSIRQPAFKVPSSSGVGFVADASTTLRTSAHYGLRLFADYNLLPPHGRGSAEHISTVSFGTAFIVTF